jgi:hypothetical protein
MFQLTIRLCNQPGLKVFNGAIIFELSFENPLGAHNIHRVMAWNKVPCVLVMKSSELVEQKRNYEAPRKVLSVNLLSQYAYGFYFE